MKRAVAGLVRLLVGLVDPMLVLRVVPRPVVFVAVAIARLKAERDALVDECDRLAGVFTGASDNPAR